jgi:hypothetical protein
LTPCRGGSLIVASVPFILEIDYIESLANMIKALAKGLLGRLLAYAVLGLGFWLLYQGLLRPNIPLAILGGAMILGGMYLMVTVRRIAVSPPTTDSTNDNDKEDSSGDSLHRGR